ncbi:MAG: hypothetical protein KAI67_02540 [Candidatus Pacebacteria bacterium]|nr:hypothetical protein [Candidatus Paceibacterota bacterium]
MNNKQQNELDEEKIKKDLCEMGMMTMKIVLDAIKNVISRPTGHKHFPLA